VKYKTVVTFGLAFISVFEPHGFDPNRPYKKENEYSINKKMWK
jgi:hypothetical protein